MVDVDPPPAVLTRFSTLPKPAASPSSIFRSASSPSPPPSAPSPSAAAPEAPAAAAASTW
jgi:hypothetical protein